jgi:hypothetical protein
MLKPTRSKRCHVGSFIDHEIATGGCWMIGCFVNIVLETVKNVRLVLFSHQKGYHS